MASKPYKLLYYTRIYVFLVTFFGLIRRCEKFNSIPIILILFTNKIVAFVQTPSSPQKKGDGGLYTGYKNIALIYSFAFCDKKRR